MKNLNTYDLKIIVIGNPKTGKTSFVKRWTKNIFSDIYKATIISEFGFKVFKKDGKLYRIQLWDIAGDDKNAMVTKIFAKDAHGVIIMGDATDEEAGEASLKWKAYVDEAATFLDGGKLPCIVVGNKSDLIENYDIDDNYNIQKGIKEKGFDGGFAVSSKTGLNISEAMEFLIEIIIDRIEDMESKGNEVYNTDGNYVSLEKHLSTKKRQNNEIDDIQYDNLGDDNLEIYIYKKEEEEENKYSCEIDFNELKKEYDLLSSIKDIDNFIEILDKLKDADRLKVNFYLEKVVVQIVLLISNLLGKTEEITFELLPKNMNEQDLIKFIIKEIVEIKGNDSENKNEEKNDVNNKKV